MLCFDIRSLTERAIAVDDELSLDDPVWEDGDHKPLAPLQVRGRLSPAGPDRFYWHGTIEGDVALECNRCLVETGAHVVDEAHFIFAEAGTEGLEDDPDVFLLDDRKPGIDLRPALREEWLLNVPNYALCRDDCRGLCLTCGAELNLGDCGCASKRADAHWDALHGLRNEHG